MKERANTWDKIGHAGNVGYGWKNLSSAIHYRVLLAHGKTYGSDRPTAAIRGMIIGELSRRGAK